ncbi:MAG: enoyl-CoA hydratase/isomerase family protein [Gammaproteobacteria bacterium]|nr:enoyl-CoA hydratase/isomerase family protein [Gammaproteobacteria bacterium]
MASDELLYEIEDEIGLITLNRPRAMNALTFEMYDRIGAICESVPTDGTVKAVIITGAGERAFAAGTDISLFQDFHTAEQGIEYETNFAACFERIERCPVPTIAAISGACTGGGAGIAAVCDLRIATRSLRYGFPIARTLGNCLSVAALSRLSALLGQGRLVDIMLTARLIEADEASAIGLVNEVLDDHAQLMARARTLATQLKSHAPLTMRATKELLRRIHAHGPQVDDRDIIGEVYASADFREGLEAFLAKRKPHWQGR